MRRGLTLVVATVAAVATVVPAAAAAAPLDRFSLVNGCFDARTTDGRVLTGGLGPVRMQATALGTYLLYGTAQEVVAGTAAGEVVRAAAPSPAAEWQVSGDARIGFALTNLEHGTRMDVRFKPARGCAVYPEAEVNAVGVPWKGTSDSGGIRGSIDTHGHLMGFELFGGEWHCGRPWHRYGVAYALPDCASLRQGTNGVFTEFLETGMPATDRDTVGWPTFRDWPKPGTVASEGDYYTGLKRAWLGGLRVMVSLAVDNEALCSVMTQRRRECDDMASARAQIRDLHELEEYIDAQSGGPGKGFFRIVTDPLEARRAINRGQMAVVKGIEVSRLLGCGQVDGQSQCDRGDVDRGMRELRSLGVTSFFPVHKFDNAFGGTKMDSGANGVIVGAGNRVATGRFWDVETCKTEQLDNDQAAAPGGSAVAQVLGGPLRELSPGGAVAPLYPPTPHCNTRELTDLGAYLIDQMAQQRFMVELDHMDTKTANAVLGQLEARRYSGVVSSHATNSQLSPQLMPRILGMGGFVSPTSSYTPKEYLDLWALSVAARSDRFYGGGGFGSDMNGLASQPRPGNETGNRISYPFRSLDGRVTFSRERWGRRVFDVNVDGVANYGMYPDWQEQLVQTAGPAVGQDLLRGAEAYLQMWERTTGIAPTQCLPGRTRLTFAGLGVLRLGATAETLLRATGQPSSRPGRSYRYCVQGGRRTVRVVFDRRGRSVLVARTTTAGARGVPGSGRTRLVLGRPAGRGGARIVRGVRAGRTIWVAAVTAGGARSPRRLRADLRAAGLR